VPKAPGTAGSIEGVALFLLGLLAFRSAFEQWSLGLFLLIATLNVLLFAIGCWAASRVCRATGLADPQRVVIDEICGQLIALSALFVRPSLAGVILAFVLFRMFDIWKPYPIYKLERLHGGLGVMSDDALAGIFAGVLVWLGRYARII